MSDLFEIRCLKTAQQDPGCKYPGPEGQALGTPKRGLVCLGPLRRQGELSPTVNIN